MRRAPLGCQSHLRKFYAVQVPTGSLPKYKEVLDPLLPGVDAKPIHTADFKDGRRIPTLAQLLEEVHHLLLKGCTCVGMQRQGAANCVCGCNQAGPDTYLQLEFWEEDEVPTLSACACVAGFPAIPPPAEPN